MRIAAVFELARGELERGRQRAWLILRAMTIDANPIINCLAALKVFGTEFGDHAGVVDFRLIIGQNQPRDLRRVGAKFLGTFRPAIGDRAKIADEVEELPARRQRVDKARGHDRRAVILSRVDIRLEDHDRLAVLSRVAKRDGIGSVFSQKTGERLTVNGGNTDRFKAFLDDTGRLQDRLDQISIGRILTELREIRAKRVFLAIGGRVALGATQIRLKKDQRAAIGVAFLANRLRQRFGVFIEEGLLKRRKRGNFLERSGNSADQDEGWKQRGHDRRNSKPRRCRFRGDEIVPARRIPRR